MGRRNKPSTQAADLTLMAMIMAVCGGGAVLFYAESTFADIQGIGAPQVQSLPGWRVHMASACIGVAAFVAMFFVLEALGRRSKAIAWRSSRPWLPLIGLTALASFVHIPAYAVILPGAIYSVWAYRLTQRVR